MKKVLSLAMALVMMMAVMVPAFAAELKANPESADVIINTSTLKDEDGDGVGEAGGGPCDFGEESGKIGGTRGEVEEGVWDKSLALKM